MEGGLTLSVFNGRFRSLVSVSPLKGPGRGSLSHLSATKKNNHVTDHPNAHIVPLKVLVPTHTCSSTPANGD